jgi:hypothetical protein
MENAIVFRESGQAPVPESSVESTDPNVKALSEYINRLKDAGRKIPESPMRRGCPNLGRISSEAGVPYSELRNRSVVRERLNEGIDKLGMSVFEYGAVSEAITYEQLFNAGSKWREEELQEVRIEKLKGAQIINATSEGREEELKRERSDRQQLHNTRTHLKKFMGAVEERGVPALDMKDVIGPEFREQFPQRREEIAKSISNEGTRDKFSTEIARWQESYKRLKVESSLPPDFPPAFRLVLERSGIPIERLADLAETEGRTLRAWRDGVATPSWQSFPIIERIEQILGLPPRCLVVRINTSRSQRFKVHDYPEYITVEGKKIKVRSNKQLRSDVNRLLPDDFDKRTEDDRVEVITWLYLNLVRPASEYRSKQRYVTNTGAQFLMQSLPPVVKEEWRQLVEFKRGTLPPRGCNGAARGQVQQRVYGLRC